ncbi:MAG: hypothetical protein AAF648_13415 [Pseudomonadota bacterium]
MRGSLQSVALLCTLLIWAGCAASYLASASEGHVPWCVPHLQGCDSVSATGRHGWGYFLFKAFVLPAAGLLWFYWLLCAAWLEALDASAGLRHSILIIGQVSAVALVLYVTFLGSEGDVYRALRRYGTVVYFGGTYLTQLLLLKALRDLAVDPPFVRFLSWLAVLMLVGAASFAVVANLFPEEDVLQNISEWNFGTLLCAFPALTWWLWRRQDVRLEVEPGLSARRS